MNTEAVLEFLKSDIWDQIDGGAIFDSEALYEVFDQGFVSQLKGGHWPLCEGVRASDLLWALVDSTGANIDEDDVRQLKGRDQCYALRQAILAAIEDEAAVK